MDEKERNKKIYIAGHRGMVGSAVRERLKKEGYYHIVGRTRDELDLCEEQDVRDYMAREKPDVVIIAAANVKGLLTNEHHPYTILYDNLSIQKNLIDAAHRNGVEQLILVANPNVYPRHVSQPMKEEDIFTGTPDNNHWYAMAKLAGLKLSEALREQHHCNYITLIPTNLYGPHDKFHTGTHIIPAMIRKFHQAKEEGDLPVQFWDSGLTQREFLYVEDLAEAISFFLKRHAEHPYYNVGTGIDISIRYLAETIQKTVGHKGEVHWDAAIPDSIPRVWMDVSRIHREGWTHSTRLKDGIRKTYEWFLANSMEVPDTV